MPQLQPLDLLPPDALDAPPLIPTPLTTWLHLEYVLVVELHIAKWPPILTGIGHQRLLQILVGIFLGVLSVLQILYQLHLQHLHLHQLLLLLLYLLLLRLHLRLIILLHLIQMIPLIVLLLK